MERKCVKTSLILSIILLAGTSDTLFLLRYDFPSIPLKSPFVRVKKSPSPLMLYCLYVYTIRC